MLAELEIHATIPASDLARARKFYQEKLGLSPAEEAPGGAGLIYRCYNSWFLLYPSPHAGTASHTQMGWETDDIEQEVAALKARGVVFEEYDTPNLKTVAGIATAGPIRAAWFKDSEGNLLGLVQVESAS
jgi:catechol 2,3-dioxygenase-like lactoylglutathione lyase family enzyme